MTPPTERVAPANLDAEEGVLACCILDNSQEFVAKCIDAGMTSSDFFAPKHQVIWESIVRVHNGGGGMDEILICHDLERHKTLEFAGGHAEINRLTNRVETTAHAQYWLEIVREKSLQRRIISEATGIVESVYSGRTPAEVAQKAEALADLGSEAQTGKRKLSKRKQDKLCKMAEGHFFDPLKEPPQTPLIFSLNGHHLLHKGNFLSILASKSCGKSSVVGAMGSSLFGKLGADYLKLAGFNPNSEYVIHTDTEQSRQDHDQMIRRAMRRGQVDTIPDWFKSVHLRRFAVKTRVDIVCALARRYYEERGLCCLFLEGYADFMRNINDEAENSDLISKFMELIEDTGCGIVATLHVNPGSKRGQAGEKGRGHAGTYLENVSENVLLLSKLRDKKDPTVETIKLEIKDGRHGLGSGTSLFRWNDQARMHTTVEDDDNLVPMKSLADAKEDEMVILSRDIWDGWEGGAMSHKLLTDRISAVLNCSASTAEKKRKKLVAYNLIDHRAAAGLYYKKQSNDD